VEGGFRGGALNRAARLCALARPGEVLASDAVRELAGATEGVNYGFRRVERLKGFEKPVGVVEVHPADAAPGRDLGRRLKRIARGGRPRRRALTLGVLLGAAALVAAVLATFLGDSGTSPPAAKSVVGLDPGSGKITANADAGGEFRQIVKGDGVLFGLDPDSGLIASIDPDTGAVTDRSAAPDLHPAQVAPALAYGSIWAADARAARLLRFDPRAPGSPLEITLPNPTADKTAPQSAHGVAVTRNGVWAAYGEPLRIARIDPQTNRVVLSRTLPGPTAFVGTMLARTERRSGRCSETGSASGGWTLDRATR
jgi:hypothetical protein